MPLDKNAKLGSLALPIRSSEAGFPVMPLGDSAVLESNPKLELSLQAEGTGGESVDRPGSLLAHWIQSIKRKLRWK